MNLEEEWEQKLKRYLKFLSHNARSAIYYENNNKNKNLAFGENLDPKQIKNLAYGENLDPKQIKNLAFGENLDSVINL